MWSAWLTRGVSGRVPAESRGRSGRDSEVRHESTCRSREGKTWWAGTGLNRRHQDFQSYSLGRGSARKCLLSKDGVTTAACAGVLRNDQECARVGHNLGTNRVGPLLLNDFIRPTCTYGEIVRLRAWLAHRPASRQASTSDQSQIANRTRSRTNGAAPTWTSAV